MFACNLLIVNKRGDISKETPLFREYFNFMSTKDTFSDSFHVYAGLQSLKDDPKALDNMVAGLKGFYNERAINKTISSVTTPKVTT